MCKADLVCKQLDAHRYKRAIVEHLDVSNKLYHQFNVEKFNQIICSDITYIGVGSSWCYLATVIDLNARRVVGLALSG
ncbi:hypothetical protein BTJ40_14800 [Microbulbifer sp. A4B17]|nr:hypothetical protein BTJ40_14800 [Microbulbifer sp. A4B17]